MTVERRLTVGLEDTKAISFQCKSCCAKVSRSPDSVSAIPYSCSECRISWRNQVTQSTKESESAFDKLTKSIVGIRTLMHENQLNFRILFEFEEPSNSTSK